MTYTGHGRWGMKQAMIVYDPAILMGKPVVSGTRITVELILEKLAAGETIEQILEAHPRLTREGISAALAFAAEALRADVLYPVKTEADEPSGRRERRSPNR